MAARYQLQSLYGQQIGVVDGEAQLLQLLGRIHPRALVMLSRKCLPNGAFVPNGYGNGWHSAGFWRNWLQPIIGSYQVGAPWGGSCPSNFAASNSDPYPVASRGPWW